ncbi:hypothetical protein ES708_15524 [subsurface metagenome]
MKVTKKIAPVKGVGKPDYSRQIFHITRGETPRLMEPRNEEKQKVFAIFLSAADPLLVGTPRHMIDMETFLPTPYTVPAGYTFELREWMGSCNGAISIIDTATMDGEPIIDIPIFPAPSSCVHEYEQIIAFGSHFFDPKAEHVWVFDCVITNLEAENSIQGVGQISLYLHKVGTAEMTEKTVKCKHCGHEFKVPLRQTIIDCPSCGKRFVVAFYGRAPVV